MSDWYLSHSAIKMDGYIAYVNAKTQPLYFTAHMCMGFRSAKQWSRLTKKVLQKTEPRRHSETQSKLKSYSYVL